MTCKQQLPQVRTAFNQLGLGAHTALSKLAWLAGKKKLIYNCTFTSTQISTRMDQCYVMSITNTANEKYITVGNIKSINDKERQSKTKQHAVMLPLTCPNHFNLRMQFCSKGDQVFRSLNTGNSTSATILCENIILKKRPQY